MKEIILSEAVFVVTILLSWLYIKKSYVYNVSFESPRIYLSICLLFAVVLNMATSDILLNDLLIWSASISVLYWMAYIDYKEKCVDKWLLLSLLFLGVVSLIRIDFMISLNKILTTIVLGGFMWLVYKIGKGVGFGDVKAITVLSLIFNFDAMFGIMFYSLFFGMIYGIIHIKRQKKNMKEEIPFIPFLLLGIIMYMVLVMSNG